MSSYIPVNNYVTYLLSSFPDLSTHWNKINSYSIYCTFLHHSAHLVSTEVNFISNETTAVKVLCCIVNSMITRDSIK